MNDQQRNLNIEQRLKTMLGDLLVQNQVLLARIEELEAQVREQEMQNQGKVDEAA